jgi:putative transposase
MKKSRFTDQQIIGFLRQAEAGMAVKEICRQHGFSGATFLQVARSVQRHAGKGGPRGCDLLAENA